MTSHPKNLCRASALRTRPCAEAVRQLPVLAFGIALSLSACTEGSSQPQTSATPSSTVTTTVPTVISDELPSAVVSGSEPLFNGQPPEVQVSDASAEPDVSDARLQTCTPSKGPGEILLIDDFEDGDEVLEEREGRSGIWYKYEELSGDHDLSFEQLAVARLDSSGALHTSGSDHGQWAGVGVVLSSCVYDASSYVGVHFWIRGSSAPVNVALVTPGVIPISGGGTCTKEEEGLCYDAYRSSVTVTEQWRELFVPFTSFEQLGYGPDAGPLDLTRIESIQFQSDSSAFDVWIDDLSFYVEEVYTPYDASVPTTEPGSTEPGSSASASTSGAEDTGRTENNASSGAVTSGAPELTADGGSQ